LRNKGSYRLEEDIALLKLMEHGDSSAFDELYHRYAARLARFASYTLGNDRALAEDMVQDLFIKIIENPSLYNHEYKFSTWLFSCINNRIKNEYRNKQNRNRIEEEYLAESDICIPDLRDIDLKIIKQQIIMQLEEYSYEQRTTFLLRFIEDLSIKEIAQLTECSEGTVKSRLFYTLKKLGSSLKVYEHQL
jgi:RNA polymerase sigma-70 factor (ECF subfamily)